MSQVTVSDVFDVKLMSMKDLVYWYNTQTRTLTLRAGGRYTPIIEEDRETLRKELVRRGYDELQRK